MAIHYKYTCIECGRKSITSDCTSKIISPGYYEDISYYCPNCNRVIFHMGWDDGSEIEVRE